MEIIHPPGVIFRGKSGKSHRSSGQTSLDRAWSLRPGSGQPVSPPNRFSTMFSVGTSFPGRSRPVFIIQRNP